MPQVEIPAELFREVETVVRDGSTPSDFVLRALRVQLQREADLKRFDELTAANRAAMEAQGLTEEDILADFEQWRKQDRAARRNEEHGNGHRHDP